MSRYLVTGAAGFIGSSLAKRLISDGNEVITVDNLSTGSKNNLPDGIDFIEGDIGDISTFNKIPNGYYDAIFHIAGQSSGEISFDDPIYDIKTNAESTLLLLNFCIQNNCKRLIFASTMSVYGTKPEHAVKEEEECQPQSFYGVAKLASEHYLRIYQNYGIETTSLRLFNVYGTGQNLDNLKQGMVSIYLAQMIRDRHIHVKGSPDRFRDFIHVDDVVESFYRCLDNPMSIGKSINIATGKQTRVSEIIHMLTSNYKEDITIEYEGGTPGDIHGIYADVNLMNRILGTWKKVELNDGISRMVNSYTNLKV
jgi:UDP-glucose 4-epimerase